MANKEFIGCTVGLTCNGWGKVNKLTRISYYRNADNTVTLQPESGYNGANKPGAVTISAGKFEERPCNPYDKTREAIWALGECGWEA